MEPIKITEKPSLIKLREVVMEISMRVNSLNNMTVNIVSRNSPARFSITRNQAKLDFPGILSE